MQTNELLYLLTSIVVCYLFGSIPWALIIGKIFFNTDIRNYGSKNLGGTNAGRVLGARPGVVVMALDILKLVFAGVVIIYLISPLFKIDNTLILSNIVFPSLLFGVLGHCYPIFASFKGGKAVSVAVGFLLITNPLLVAIFAICFFSTLKLFKMVSLSSMLSITITLLVSLIPVLNNFALHGLTQTIFFYLSLLLIALILIYRHMDNIKRIIKKEERKIKWM